MALPIRHYTLKLVTSAGVTLNYLRDAFNATYTQTFNQSPTLTFSLPSTSITLSTLVRPNEVWVYDSTNTLVEKFRILRTNISRDNSGAAAIEVSCDGYLNQLTDELISSYQASPTDAFTITEIIEDLLALQVSTSPIVYDATLIDADLSSLVRSVNLENQTILRAILALIETVSTPYYLYISPSTKKLHITATLGQDIGQEIRLGKNLSAISQESDYSTLTTRLIAIGSGSEDVEVRLTPMGVIPTIYWSFNGTPNDLMSAAAGTYDLTAVGTPTYSDKLGPTNGDSIILDGATQYLSHPSSVFRQYASRTCSGFVKFLSFPTSSNFGIIFCEQSSTDNDPFVRLEVHNNGTNTRLRAHIADNGGTQRLLQRGTTDLALDTWYHFAVIDDGSNLRYYLNGSAEIASTAYVGTITTDLFTLGARKLMASVSLYAEIELSGVRIHNSVLSAANILIDATTTNKFIDSTAKTTYGIVPRAISDRSITHPDTLFLAALTHLYANDSPFTSYKVSTLDLTKVPGTPFTSFENITLGSTVRLIDSGLSISASQIAVKKTTDLSTPTNVTFEFSSLTRLITDPNSIYSTINLVQSQAVETIGAGQVIVRGTFTVLNWVTDGETTIDGDNLTTGTITADKINVDELSAINIYTGDLEVQGAGATPGTINLPSGGVIKSGMTAFATGNGFWMDNSGGTSRFAMGNTVSAQLVVDSGFDDAAEWFEGAATVTVTSSQARFVNAAVGDFISQSIPIIPGASYTVAYVINASGSSLGSGSDAMNVNLGGTAGITRTATGSYSETIVAGSTHDAIVVRISAATGTADMRVDSITVTGPDASASGLIKWDGSTLTVVGTIHARSIYAGTLYADRVPRLGNVDLDGSYIQTSTPNALGLWISDAAFYTGTGHGGSSGTITFYTPSDSLPLTCKLVFKLVSAYVGGAAGGATSAESIQLVWKVNGVTRLTVVWNEGDAFGTFYESSEFTISSGVSQTVELTWTFFVNLNASGAQSTTSGGSNAFTTANHSIRASGKGDHEVV